MKLLQFRHVINHFIIINIVDTCSILGEKYSCGVLCVTEEYLYFVDAITKEGFSLPLHSIQKLRFSINDLFTDGISFSSLNEKVC